MIGRLILIVFLLDSMVPIQASIASWDTVVFRDDFNGPGGPLDSDVWIVNQPDSWWWVQGRTFFPSPVYHPDGPFPRVENGACVIEHHLHNPYDLSPSPWTFLGGEIHTVMVFDASRPYRIEARVRCLGCPDGLVASFFKYGYDGSNSDEIDFEFVSNKINDTVNYPDGDPVLVNTWNESQQLPEYVAPEGLDLSEWNTFRIYWYPPDLPSYPPPPAITPGPQPVPPFVVWSWLDPSDNDSEVWLRTETNPAYIPDEPMSVFFNFWAPTEVWPEAYDSDLQPVDDPNQSEIHRYEIDYVEVRVPEPATSGLLGAGLLAVGGLAMVRVRSKKTTG